MMAGTWQKLANSPGFAASTMLLLTDGSVMCQQSGGINWSKLTPDHTGSYINGTWTPLAAMANTRLYYASAVLRDGRVIVCGGEYSSAGSETNSCEIYDPTHDGNGWKAVTPPTGWANIGDAPSCLLPDGRLLLGNGGVSTAIYDPIAHSWVAGPNKGDPGSEETWTLLPDQSVLTVQCNNTPYAERYVGASNAWQPAGMLPVNLVDAMTEVGPACLRPDGSVFCIGATGHNALRSPTGAWAAAPDSPHVGGRPVGAQDAPACLLPNGKVLFVGGPVDGGEFSSPTYFFEYDGNAITQVLPAPPIAGGPTFVGRMMLLPTGQVLFASGANDIYCYTPDGHPQDAWRPTITAVPHQLQPGGTYTLYGQQLNGLSQAVSYGDDASMATNYPIIRIRPHSTGDIHYCRTFDHSTMGVATGTELNWTNFDVPSDVPAGPADITVIANGIPSQPASVMVLPRRSLSNYDLWNELIGSLADGPLWVLGRNGPVPVGPWGPELAREAKAAHEEIIAGIKRLEALGKQVANKQAHAAASVAPAVDPRLSANSAN